MQGQTHRRNQDSLMPEGTDSLCSYGDTFALLKQLAGSEERHRQSKIAAALVGCQPTCFARINRTLHLTPEWKPLHTRRPAFRRRQTRLTRPGTAGSRGVQSSSVPSLSRRTPTGSVRRGDKTRRPSYGDLALLERGFSPSSSSFCSTWL